MNNENEKKEIKQTLTEWNDAIKTRDIERAIAIFDDHPDIILIGSESEEVFTGRDEIREHIHRFFKNPYTIHWDLNNVKTDQNDNTAWAFVNGSAIITGDDGTISGMPYRYMVVMIKSDSSWKWRIFNGSEPSKKQ